MAKFRATCGRPRSIIRRSTSWRGTATTRRTSTICGASTRSARSPSTIPTRRSSWCCLRRRDTPGVDNMRLRDLPAALAGGGGHVPPAVVPSQHHHEFMGLIHGVYDAKAEGFVPGGAACTTACRPRTRCRDVREGSAADTVEAALHHATRWRSCSRRARDPADALRAGDGAAAARLLALLAGTEEALRSGNGLEGKGKNQSCIPMTHG